MNRIQTAPLWAREDAQHVEAANPVSSGPSHQNRLKTAVSLIQRTVSMTRVEIILPAEMPEVPADLVQAFGDREWVDVGGSNCFAILGLDLTRALSQAEEDATMEPDIQKCVLTFRTLTR